MPKTSRKRKARGLPHPVRPAKETVAPTTDHKFAVGDIVRLVEVRAGPVRTTGTYRVVRLLPENEGGLQYRIKSDTEAYERVIHESQLLARLS